MNHAVFVFVCFCMQEVLSTYSLNENKENTWGQSWPNV